MTFISLMEFTGTVAFAVSGALVAIEKKLDCYGIAFLAIITAVGGGIYVHLFWHNSGDKAFIRKI